MIDLPPDFGDLVDATEEVAISAEENPLEHFRPTPPQREWLACREPRFQMRGGNQLGKTIAQSVKVLEMMRGPDLARWVPADLIPEPPIECWVVCTSWKQSLTVMRKIYELMPKAELDPGSNFSKKNGFTGQSFQLRNGSLCTFVTAKQDADELASATLHYIGVDEPPPESKWGELAARVRHHRGQIGLTYTPVNRPVGWLRAKVEAGDIHDIQAPLTLENVWPIGADRPFQTQDQIDQFILDVPAWERAQRVEGDWDGVTVDRWIEDFHESEHAGIFHPDGGAALGIGIDYGLQPGKMAAVMVAVQHGRSTAPKVWVWDEACAPEGERWGTEDLVDAIMVMLKRNDLRPEHVDFWIGDRSAQGKSRKLENASTRALLAERMEVAVSQAPNIETPRKYAGSVAYGCALLNGLARRDRLRVHARCRRFIDFLNHFKGDPRDPVKDAGDAGRYPIVRMVDPRGWFSYRTTFM